MVIEKHDKFNNFILNLARNTSTQSAKLETVPVVMDLNLFEQFRDGLKSDLRRRNWKLFDNCGITDSEWLSYLALPLIYRVSNFEDVDQSETTSRKIYGNLPRHQVNNLVYPFWIEHVVSQVGIAVDYDYGLKFIPVLDESVVDKVDQIDFRRLAEIHHLLQAFEEHGLAVVKNVLPKGNEGNIDVMAMTIIQSIVRSYKHHHPAGSYIAAFLGNKLQNVQQWSALFRVHYEDVDYIKTQFELASHFYGGDGHD